MSDELSQYFAFISYSHKDKAFARKLHRHLVHYKLPAILGKQYPLLPKKVRPVFIDLENLKSGHLTNNLYTSLDASRYLIVICSEHSAHPNSKGKHHVNDEVTHFLATNPEEKLTRVIPVICRKSDDEHYSTCLPPRLREHEELFGIDVREKGIERTFNNVVAAMLNVDPDLLWQSWERTQARRRRWCRILGTAAALLAAIGGWHAYDYWVPHYSYYADYIERNNVPEGIHPISKEVASARQYHYRFTTRKHLVRKVEYCNSADTPVEHADFWNQERPAIMELEYGESGKATERIHRDASGQVARKLKFSSGNIDFVRLTQDGQESSAAAAFITSSNFHTINETRNQRSDVGRHAVQRVTCGPLKGIVIEESYRKAFSQNPAQDNSGIRGRSYELDGEGRVTTVRYQKSPAQADKLPLEPQPQQTALPPHVHGYTLNYGNPTRAGEAGKVVTITHIGQNGTPVPADAHWASASLSYNEQGNLQEVAYHDTNDKLCMLPDGYAIARHTYDSRGNRIESHLFGADGEPCTNTDEWSFRKERYDARGRVIQQEFYDTKGQRCTSQTTGSSRICLAYDEAGNLLETRHYDVDDKPCLCKDDYHRSTSEYDQHGNLIKHAFFGTDNKPCVAAGGYASATYQYDHRGYTTKGACFDVDGAPVSSSHIHARVERQYDEAGNITEEAYYDADGAPHGDAEGHSRITARYSAQNNIIEQRYFGIDNKPKADNDGCARIVHRYDEGGNIIERLFFGADGNPTGNSEGHARISIHYNEEGDITEVLYYDEHNMPHEDEDGHARWTRRYNEQGKLIEQAYFGVDGKPKADKDGHARRTWDFDEQGNAIEQAYYGEDGLPHADADGYARITARYNEQGKMIERCYFGVDGKPKADRDGHARITRRYDDQSQVIEEAYYGEDGHPGGNAWGISRVSIEYDEQGNRTSIIKYDVHGNAIQDE